MNSKYICPSLTGKTHDIEDDEGKLRGMSDDALDNLGEVKVLGGPALYPHISLLLDLVRANAQNTNTNFRYA
jgi:hypothetical protein